MKAPIAWLQLRHKPLRLAIALLGISFAVVLIMMQLAFRSAMFESAVRYHERFDYDIALFSTDSVYIVKPRSFSIRRLYQALAHDDVADVDPVYIQQTIFKNPWENQRRNINVFGFEMDKTLLQTHGLDVLLPMLNQQDVIAFDAASRPEFGPVADTVAEEGTFVTEISDRDMTIIGTFTMGTSFGIDGSLISNVDNWLRLFPEHSRENIELGLIHLEPGADAAAVRDDLKDYLPEDILVMTKADFVQREKEYWNSATPIGYVFAFGAIMGFIVGAIIVYQILFADVSEHINEYATLRALGYPNHFISGIVVQQSIILGVLGFIPGVLAVGWLYGKASAATSLPLYLTVDRTTTVFLMTLAMCAISALLAIRKVRRLDPADVF